LPRAKRDVHHADVKLLTVRERVDPKTFGVYQLLAVAAVLEAGLIVVVAAVVAALTIAGIPTAHAEFKTGKVCNAQGVCCVLTATGQIADCLYPGSPGMPGNPGEYQDPFPANAVTVPPRGPIDPAHSDAGQCVLFPNTPGCR
jgi:hypothetical protein